jgi:hypothetical protein
MLVGNEQVGLLRFLQRWLAKFQKIWKKGKMVSTFILFLCSLSLWGEGKPACRWAGMRRYELKCSQYSSLYLIEAKIQRLAELTFKNWLIFCTI